MVFKEGDVVQIRLKKGMFSIGSFGKFQPRIDDLFKIVKTNHNSYKIILSGDYNIYVIFYVANLSPYYE